MLDGAKLQLIQTVLTTTMLDIKAPLSLLQRQLSTEELLQLITCGLLSLNPNDVMARIPSAVLVDPAYVSWPLSLPEVEPLLELAIRNKCSYGVSRLLALLGTSTITAKAAEQLLVLAGEVRCLGCWKVLLEVLSPVLLLAPEVSQKLYLSCGGTKRCSSPMHAACGGCTLVSCMAAAACKAAAAKQVPQDKLLSWELYLYEASLTHSAAAPATWRLLQLAPHDADIMQRVLLAVLRAPSGPTSSSFWGPLLQQQAAVSLPPHVVQQLLEEAIERRGFAAAAVGLLLSSCAAAKDLPWVVVQQLLQRCFRGDAADLVQLLLQQLPAANDIPGEVVYQMLESTQQAAPACLPMLFPLLASAEEMPYSVRKAFIGGLVVDTGCLQQKGPCHCGMCPPPAPCLVCALLKSTPALPPAVLVDALKGASSEGEGDDATLWVAHEPGFALAPGVQELSEEHVLDVLLSVIHAPVLACSDAAQVGDPLSAQPVAEGPAQQLLRRFEEQEGLEEILDYDDDDEEEEEAGVDGAAAGAPPPAAAAGGGVHAVPVPWEAADEELLDYEPGVNIPAAFGGPAAAGGGVPAAPVAADVPAAHPDAGEAEDEELLDYEPGVDGPAAFEAPALAPGAGGAAAAAANGAADEEVLDYDAEPVGDEAGAVGPPALAQAAAGVPAAEPEEEEAADEMLLDHEPGVDGAGAVGEPVIAPAAAGMPAEQEAADEELQDDEPGVDGPAGGMPAAEPAAEEAADEELLDYDAEPVGDGPAAFQAPAAFGAYGAPAAFGAFGAPAAFGPYGAPAAFGAYGGAAGFGAYGGPAAFGAYGGTAGFGAYGGAAAFGAYGGAAGFGAYGGAAGFGAYGGPAAIGAYGAAAGPAAGGAPAAFGGLAAQPAEGEAADEELVDYEPGGDGPAALVGPAPAPGAVGPPAAPAAGGAPAAGSVPAVQQAEEELLDYDEEHVIAALIAKAAAPAPAEEAAPGTEAAAEDEAKSAMEPAGPVMMRLSVLSGILGYHKGRVLSAEAGEQLRAKAVAEGVRGVEQMQQVLHGKVLAAPAPPQAAGAGV